MGIYKIPSDTFFRGSPEIRIRCAKDHDGFVSESMKREKGEIDKGGEMNCFLRPTTDEKRDGHLMRLRGVHRMDYFLRRMGSSA
jgi:hypothetical protein